jgi:hypothetical protein
MLGLCRGGASGRKQFLLKSERNPAAPSGDRFGGFYGGRRRFGHPLDLSGGDGFNLKFVHVLYRFFWGLFRRLHGFHHRRVIGFVERGGQLLHER